MPPDARDVAKLWDMLQSARTVVRFAAGRTFDQYQNDDLLRSAVERQIEIIGEAARAVSTAFKTGHPEISWRAIIAQRHVLAHDYGAIDHPRIWRVVTVHIPALIPLLEPHVPPPPTMP